LYSLFSELHVIVHAYEYEQVNQFGMTKDICLPHFSSQLVVLLARLFQLGNVYTCSIIYRVYSDK